MTEPVARVVEILQSSVRYPWKTAEYLRRRLANDGITVSTRELESALLEHAARPERAVRYSFFPARKSLDLLWGHVDVVNDPKNLPDPHLETEFGGFDPCTVPAERPWCFLSHSFRDLPRVTSIYERLLERGYGAWLAEAEVMTGMMIVKAVQDGLDLCDRFVLVATPNSLASRWVLKEASQAIVRWSLPITVIVDGAGQDDGLISLFADWLDDRWDETTLENRLAALRADNPPDPAATQLEDLLVKGLGEPVPQERRVVVLDPFPDVPGHAGFRSLDEEFPDLS